MTTKILPVAKITFWLSFALGNICLFGYLLTRNEIFPICGYLLLIFGTVVNLFVMSGLLFYGIKNPKMKKISEKSALFLLLNIPIAIVYAIVGYSLLA